jgi:hypothetical protein
MRTNASYVRYVAAIEDIFMVSNVLTMFQCDLLFLAMVTFVIAATQPPVVARRAMGVMVRKSGSAMFSVRLCVWGPLPSSVASPIRSYIVFKALRET